MPGEVENSNNNALYEQKLNELRKKAIYEIERLCSLHGSKLSTEEIEKYVNMELMPTLKTHAKNQNEDIKSLFTMSEPLKSFIIGVSNSTDSVENKIQSLLVVSQKTEKLRNSYVEKTDNLSFSELYNQFYKKIIIASGIGNNEAFVQDVGIFLRMSKEEVESFFKNNNKESVNSFFMEFYNRIKDLATTLDNKSKSETEVSVSARSRGFINVLTISLILLVISIISIFIGVSIIN